MELHLGNENKPPISCDGNVFRLISQLAFEDSSRSHDWRRRLRISSVDFHNFHLNCRNQQSKQFITALFFYFWKRPRNFGANIKQSRRIRPRVKSVTVGNCGLRCRLAVTILTDRRDLLGLSWKLPNEILDVLNLRKSSQRCKFHKNTENCVRKY